MSKYDFMRYRRYRTQAESSRYDLFLDALCKRNLFIYFLYSRSHSVWKMTYAINLTLLVLLINMVIVFGATMVNNIL